ncbi:ATP/GTP-binding protein [Oscillatoria sp. FACHB-1406]|uniref:AAA family ATPase n=1 Tax=Oscillatoria sp. FACHB-1406 TaxID=2692846 RepID=UPI001681F7EA|nr:ATP/GTP-binding protein [Oscillatoria sp. FACHB-1406]MBD2578867.1 AAA family ATPase [Oscillatoria sp. FACHB-1406]
MLVQVTIENLLSFKEETTFSLRGVRRDEHHTNHLAIDAAGKGISVLPISAIYGANAAGKSNLIEAIGFAQDLIVEGTRSDRLIPIAPFKLSNDRLSPSKIEFKFTHQGFLYSYGFKLNRERIFEEWLDATSLAGNKREKLVFERTTSEDKETEVEFGTILRGRSKKQAQFLEFVAQGTRPNQLFLTEAVERNVEKLIPVIDWFRNSLTIVPADSKFRGLELGVLNSKEFTHFLNEFLKLADTGIASIGTEEIELDFDRHFPDIPNEIREDILQSFLRADEDSLALIESNFVQYFIKKFKQNQLKLIQLKTQHYDAKGNLVDFSLTEESEGTQRLIHLLPILFMFQEEDSEKVVLLDELDRRLHPLLSRILIELTLKCREANNRNQLIFTTHDTNLLDLDLLRKDEIWFVEKDKRGESHLYSLAAFKNVEGLQIEKGYLNGRFGAIPFFGDIRHLNWLDCESESSDNKNGKGNKDWSD